MATLIRDRSNDHIHALTYIVYTFRCCNLATITFCFVKYDDFTKYNGEYYMLTYVHVL